MRRCWWCHGRIWPWSRYREHPACRAQREQRVLESIARDPELMLDTEEALRLWLTGAMVNTMRLGPRPPGIERSPLIKGPEDPT